LKNKTIEVMKIGKAIKEVTRPPAVVISASETFLVSASGSLPPESPMVSIAPIIPTIVLVSPISGGITMHAAEIQIILRQNVVRSEFGVGGGVVINF
jgi:hypothetical protein